VPDIEVNIEVLCAACGAGLCNQTNTGKHRNQPAMFVEPCQECLRKEHDAGYEEGEKEARNEK